MNTTKYLSDRIKEQQRIKEILETFDSDKDKEYKTIQNLIKINGIDTDRLKELFDLETFDIDDVKELEEIIYYISKYIDFLKALII